MFSQKNSLLSYQETLENLRLGIFGVIAVCCARHTCSLLLYSWGRQEAEEPTLEEKMCVPEVTLTWEESFL